MAQPTIRLTVNGRIHDVRAAPDTALLYVLRNDLELNGPKYGCGLGEWGACAVLIDGLTAPSCAIPISACAGRDIVTLERLCPPGPPAPVRRSYRNRARGDAGGGTCRGGTGLMAVPAPPMKPELRTGSLSIVRRVGSGAEAGFETFIKITAGGSVTAFNGHVDLGTGIRTALGQIVAEELDVSFARVVVVLGDTSLVPNQGATIASETIQITAVPLRNAAAQPRHLLTARAAERLEEPVEELSLGDGLIRGTDNPRGRFGEVIAGERLRLGLGEAVAVT